MTEPENSCCASSNILRIMADSMHRAFENTAKRRKIEFNITNTTNFDPSFPFTTQDNSIKTINPITTTNSRRLSQDYIEWQLKRNPKDKPEQPSHILLFTVFNPTNHNITCNVLYTICSPIATVVRILIFKKNGIQAMIEFESIESASSVKESLHGCDIYTGCCTLKIEYSPPGTTSKLNVYKKNNDISWDYTNMFVETNSDDSARRVLLEDPSCNNGNNEHSRSLMTTPFKRNPVADAKNIASTDDAIRHEFLSNRKKNLVCIIYGLNLKKINTTKLFNLLCVYGNVIRIKFLKTKEGCAMVQMGDAVAVERVIAFLHDINLFGSRIQINHSKQLVLMDVHVPYQLSDGTTSFKDFSSSKMNRFSTPETASKNRIQRPSKILHFFNAPANMDSKDIDKIFTHQNDKNLKPTSIKMFNSKSEKSSSGLVEFDNLEHALEALVLCNHKSIPSPNTNYPYIMKLCFSTSSVRW